MRNILEFVNKLAKLILVRVYKSELTVLVKVKIDNLNEFSKFILSKVKIPERKKRHKKNEIKTRNAKLTSSFIIFLFENKILWLKTLLGLTNFKISINEIFKRIYTLINFIPDVLEIIEPPIIVKNKRKSEKLFGTLDIAIPEFPILLSTTIKISTKFKFCNEKNKITVKIIVRNNKAISS